MRVSGHMRRWSQITRLVGVMLDRLFFTCHLMVLDYTLPGLLVTHAALLILINIFITGVGLNAVDFKDRHFLFRLN